MFLYNINVNSEGCGDKLLTSARKNLGPHYRLLHPYIAAETPPPSPWLRNWIRHTIPAFFYCGS